MKDCQYGFTLAGFEQVITDRGKVLEVFSALVKKNEPGLVFIDERLLSEENIGPLHILEKQWGGAFISVPAPARGEEMAAVDFGKRFISKVLGYQMKLN